MHSAHHSHSNNHNHTHAHGHGHGHGHGHVQPISPSTMSSSSFPFLSSLAHEFRRSRIWLKLKSLTTTAATAVSASSTPATGVRTLHQGSTHWQSHHKSLHVIPSSNVSTFRHKCLRAFGLLLLQLSLFFLMLHLFSRHYQDGRSRLLESTPLIRCSGNPVSTIECRSEQTDSHYEFHPTSLIWPREIAPTPLPPPPPPTLPLPTQTPANAISNSNILAQRNTALLQDQAYPSLSLPGFYVVSYGSSLYFDRLMNFLGSMHFFEPAQHALVWDLGLTPLQRERLSCLSYVTVEDLPFDEFPLHVQNLFNYAWKILIMDQLSKMPHVKSFVLLDAGVELSKPNALLTIKIQLRDVGFWGVEQSNFVGVKSSPQTLQRLGVDIEVLKTKPFCAGGLIGFTFGKGPYEKIMKTAVNCALDEACIAPRGSGRGTHNYDQSVLSALIYQHPGLKCETAREYREWALSRITFSPSSYNQQVLTLRRWHQPKPYASSDYLLQNLTSSSCTFRSSQEWHLLTSIQHVGPALQQRLDTWKKQVATWPAHSTHPHPVLFLEHTEGSHLHDSSPLLQCLLKFLHDRTQCIPLIETHFQTMIASRIKMENAWYDPLQIDAVFNPFVRTMRMNYFITLLTFFLAAAVVYSLRQYYLHLKEAGRSHVHAHVDGPDIDEEMSDMTPDDGDAKPLLVYPISGRPRSLPAAIAYAIPRRIQSMSRCALVFMSIVILSSIFVWVLLLCPDCSISHSWFRLHLSHEYEPAHIAAPTGQFVAELQSNTFPSCSLNEWSCVEKASWQPSVKLVVAMDMNLNEACGSDSTELVHSDIPDDNCKTRIAEQFKLLRDTAESLTSSVVKPAMLHVSITRPIFLHSWLQQTLADHATVNGFIVQFHIIGDQTQLFTLDAVLESEHLPSTMIAVFPIGTRVPPFALLRLSFSLEYHRIHELEPAVYGACGWTLMHAAEPQAIRLIPSVSDGSRVDVLNPACGVMYRRDLFDDVAQAELRNQDAMASHCWQKQYIWITGAMLTHAQSFLPVPQVLIHLSEQRHESEQMLKASESSSSPRSLIQCVRAVESTFGDWRGTRRTKLRIGY